MKVIFVSIILYVICGMISQFLFLLDERSDSNYIDVESFGISIFLFFCGWIGLFPMLFIFIGERIYKIISSQNYFNAFLNGINSIFNKIERKK